MLRLALYLVQASPSVNEVRFRADESDNPTVDTRLFASDAAAAARPSTSS